MDTTTAPGEKDLLLTYLRRSSADLVRKLDTLGEYDVRRPLVPSGASLLGLVKHVATVQLEYFGEVFDRPGGRELPWSGDEADPDADMWMTAEESREDILVHMISETAQHAGHADILRELIDGAVGRGSSDALGGASARAHHDRVEDAASAVRDGTVGVLHEESGERP